MGVYVTSMEGAFLRCRVGIVASSGVGSFVRFPRCISGGCGSNCVAEARCSSLVELRLLGRCNNV